MMIGAKNDPSFGPTVLIGRGGTEAEAVQDVALRLAPLSLSDARQMMGELKSSVLFDGWRSGASYDREAFAETVVTIGELINGHPEIREMDLNPVRVHEKGVSVLDAVMVCV
jgi:acyl-CoA synthetase (NDP forming)